MITPRPTYMLIHKPLTRKNYETNVRLVKKINHIIQLLNKTN